MGLLCHNLVSQGAFVLILLLNIWKQEYFYFTKIFQSPKFSSIMPPSVKL